MANGIDFRAQCRYEFAVKRGYFRALAWGFLSRTAGRSNKSPSAWLNGLAGILIFSAAGAEAQQPTIDDFSPTAGTTGDQILLTGTGFSVGTMKVYFWRGVPAGTSVTSDTTMRVTVPSAAISGPLGVQRDFGATNYTALNFTRIGSGPYITDFTPAYGAPNQMVVINGVHFTGVAANGVKFGGKGAVDASVNAAGTSISVHVPSGAVSGPITVTTPQGSSNSVASFTVLGPGPFITGFSPSRGTAGTTVLIDGLQFTTATNATFNGVPGANFAVQSSTLIRVDAPAGVTSGPITVSSPSGSWTTISNFLVPPVITNVTPASGRSGTNVIITGANFLGTTAVSFNGVPAAYSVVTNTIIQATVPAGATTGLIRITTPAYSAFSAGDFVVKPTISGFTPTAGSEGTSVVITGANLNVGTPVIQFNGVQAAAPTGVSFGQLTAVVPGGATTGPITVTTTDGSDTSATNFFLPPAITSLAPTNSAPGTQVTVTGRNFLGASQVLFNGAPGAGFTVNSNSSITVTVPTGVSTGPLQVTTPAGTATSAGLFYAAPVITGFMPASGLPGTNVTITGTNFLGAKAVRFKGLAGAIVSIQNGSIVATVPNGVETGPISVEAPAGTNTTAANFVVEYPANLEVWMTNSPAAPVVDGNLVFSITMNNRGPFNGLNARWTNSFPASAVIDSVTVGAPWTVQTNGATVIATASSASAGGSSTMLVAVRPQSAGNFQVTSSISSDSPDPVPGNNSVAVTVFVEPLALLSIRQLDTSVVISWPLLLSNYLLEANSSLTNPSNWLAVTNVPVIYGSQKLVTDTNSTTSKYYRLKK